MQPSHEPVSQTDFSQFEVLLIDDSKTMIELLSTVLRAFGIGKVHTTSDPTEAKNILMNNDVDCVITDWMMQPMSGLTVSKNIRYHKWKVDRKVPIIMCSAYTDLKHLRIALEAGVDEVLTKPITVASVFDKLYAALFHRRPFIISKTYVGPKIRARFWGDEDEEDQDSNVIALDNPLAGISSLQDEEDEFLV